ncbi:MAG: hypothetical protein H7A45_10045 [Verrucomicrobiales bacterium]|nr:hypothetical protein [Verrucomicrobiales bacterium]MCP5528613.1 hypothetical protein [Verrucomicrobiales bacterium]
MKRFFRILWNAVRNQRVSLMAFFLGAVLLGLSARLFGLQLLGDAWDWFDKLLGMLTLFVAVVLWFGEAAEDWEEGLPKRLRAVFLHEGAPVMVCENAVLVSENDVRAWGQQLGAQMAGERQLAFAPFFSLGAPRIALTDEGDCKVHEICFHLRELPARLQALRDEQPGACLVWRQHGVKPEESVVAGSTVSAPAH